jgi:hypothetical protein
MKKITKKKGLFDHKFTLTVVDRLSKLKLEEQAPKKLAEANYHLLKMKSLPK